MLAQPFQFKPSVGDWFAWLSFLTEWLEGNPCDLVVFDTLSAVWPIKNENDAGEVQAALMPLRKLAAGRSLVIIHHLKKFDTGDGTGTRGSGALMGFVDIVAEMRRYGKQGNAKDVDDDSDDRRRVITSVSRWDETPKKLVIRLKDDSSDYTAEGDGKEIEQAKLRDSIWSLLPLVPGKTADEIHELLPENRRPKRGDVSKTLNQGVMESLWQGEGSGRKNNPRRFWKAG